MPRDAAAKDPNAFPYWQLTVLAFNSILAYSYPMVQDLQGQDDTDAGFYSGLLVSAYAVAEALTAMAWGSLSDRIGRKPVVLSGLGGVAVSCLILGFAKQYWVALLARLIGGALNGNVSVMQTMVAEMVKLPEHEPAAYATQPFVWTLGGIIGSALGGFLAQPARYYPELFAQDGIFAEYPYLLPNLASLAFITLAIAQGILFLEETNPRAKAAKPSATIDSKDEAALSEPERIPRASTEDEIRPLLMEHSVVPPEGQIIDIKRPQFGTIRAVDAQSEGDASEVTDAVTYNGPLWNRTIIMLVVALVLIAYHQMAFGALLPIHILDPPAAPPGQLDLRGGFGRTLHDVSTFLAVNGVISLFVQAFIFPIFVAKVGVWHSFLAMIVLYPTAYLVVPFLSAFPKFISAGVYLSLIMQAFYGIIVTPTALILLKDATPSSLMLGRVNGLAMSACCAARTLSPPLAGMIYSAGGSAAAWFSCAVVAVMGAVHLFWVPRRHIHETAGQDASHGDADAQSLASASSDDTQYA